MGHELRRLIAIVETATRDQPHAVLSDSVQIACACGLDHLAETTADVPVDFGDYDLQRKYADFNIKLFGSELPAIPIRFAKMKAIGGKVDARVTRPANARRSPVTGAYAGETMIPGSLRMTISTVYVRSEQGLDAILLHEMVHVWVMAVAGDLRDNHGPTFLRKAREISAKVGYQIPLTDAVSELEVAPSTVRPVGVILLEKKDGTFQFGIVSLAAIRATLVAIEARWRGMLPYAAQRVMVFEIATPEWTAMALRHPVQRKTDSSMKFWSMRSELALADLRANGKLLLSIE